jgi:hypothetical protein
MTPQPNGPTVNSQRIHRKVFFEPALTKEEVDATLDAMQDWVDNTHGLISFEFPTGPAPDGVLHWKGAGCNDSMYILVTTSDTPLVRDYEAQKRKSGDLPSTQETLAFTTNDCEVHTTTIIRDRIEGRNELYRVMLHEMGHQWGIDHVKDGESMMRPSMDDASVCLTKKDMELFCDLHDCEADKMGYCEP